MKNKYNIQKLLSFLPIFLALIADVILYLVYENFPIVQIQSDLAGIFIFTGLLISFHLLIMTGEKERNEKARMDLEEKSKDSHYQFINRLHHEIKNPLSIMRTGLSILNSQTSEEMITTTSEKDILISMQKQVSRIQLMISNLRKLSDLEKCIIENEKIDMNIFLEELFSDLCSNNGIKRQFSLSIPSEPWELSMIETDIDLLTHAIQNLLDNAMKYTNEDDLIEIRAYEDQKEMTIEISDSGIGIPQDEISEIWDGLFRANNARTVEGSGLGLAMVKIIINRLGGDVFVRSKLDKGTSFTVKLKKT